MPSLIENLELMENIVIESIEEKLCGNMENIGKSATTVYWMIAQVMVLYCTTLLFYFLISDFLQIFLLFRICI